MLVENKINIISNKKKLNWIKGFVAVIKKYLSRVDATNLSIESLFFENLKLKQINEISRKILIIMDEEDDDIAIINYINEIGQYKELYLILLSPIQQLKNITTKYQLASLYNQSNPENRLNPFKINIKSDYWIEIIDIVNFLKKNTAINAGKTIALTWCSEELLSYRKLLASELQHNGYNIQLLNFDESANSLSGIFFSCDYIIHFLGGTKAKELSPTGIPADRYQLELALKFLEEHKNIKLKRFIWEIPRSKIRDDENHAFLAKLSSNEKLLLKADYVKIEFTKLKSLIIRTIKQDTMNSEFSLYAGTNTIKILIMYQDINEVENEIAAKIEFEISPKIKLLNRPENYILPNKYRQYLIDADIAILFYFDKNPQWLQSKLIDLTKANGYGRKKEWLAKYLVINYEWHEKTKDNLEVINIKKTNFINKLQFDLKKRI